MPQFAVLPNDAGSCSVVYMMSLRLQYDAKELEIVKILLNYLVIEGRKHRKMIAVFAVLTNSMNRIFRLNSELLDEFGQYLTR